MNPSSRIRKLYQQADLQIDPLVDQRILDTANERLEQWTRSRPETRRVCIWRFIMFNKYGRMAAIAVILLAVLLLAPHLTGVQTETSTPDVKEIVTGSGTNPENPLESPQNQKTLQEEWLLADSLYANHDQAGLLALLETGQQETQIAVAGYLGEIGDEQAIPALQKLADTWQGQGINPYLKAIEGILERLKENHEEFQEQANSGLVDKESVKSISLAGVVVDAGTGMPIPYASVGLKSSALKPSDGKGSFTLSLDANHQDYSVYVMAEGYASKRETVSLNGNTSQSLKIELTPGSQVVGVVNNVDGLPVAGASVEAWPFAGPPVQTNAQGEFVVGGINPHYQPCNLNISHPDYCFLRLTFSPPAAGGTVFQEGILRAGVTVSGQVKDLQGQPVLGATISISPGHISNVQTDSEGRYRFVHVPAGEVVLSASDPLHAPYVGQYALTENQSEWTLDIQLPASRTLEGLVLNQDGVPIDNASISISQYKGVRYLNTGRVVTDPNGRFLIPNAPITGPLTLWAMAPGRVGRDYEVDLEQESHRIEMHTTGAIYGQVLDFQTGDPITNFRVRLDATDIGKVSRHFGATWVREGYHFTSAQGCFDTHREGLPVGGQYKMMVYADGYNPLTCDPVVVQPFSSDPNRSLFRMQSADIIAGRVVDQEGNAVVGAAVISFSANHKFDQDYWVTSGTDQDGFFSLDGGLWERPYVGISAPDYAPQIILRSELVSESEDLVTIELTEGATLQGYVVDTNGIGIVNASVDARRTSSMARGPLDETYRIFDRSTRTDQDGFYQIEDLVPGEYRVRVSLKSNCPIDQKVLSIAKGDLQELDFKPQGEHRLTGKFRVNDYPLENAQVKLDWGSDDFVAGYTDARGCFSLSGLQAGDYTLSMEWYDNEVEVPVSWLHLEQYVYYRTVNIPDDSNLDINVGHGSIQGSIPEEFISHEDLRLTIRRKGPDTQRYGSRYSDWQGIPGIRPVLDEEGAFKIEPLFTGQYFMALSDQDRVLAISDVMDLAPSEDCPSVKWNYGNGKIDLQVIDAETGEPIPEARFMAHHSLPYRFYNSSKEQVDDDGKCLFDGLPSGTYWVIASAEGYLGSQSDPIEVVDGQVASLAIALLPAVQVNFEVSDELLKFIVADSVQIDCCLVNSQTEALDQRLTVWGTDDRYSISMPKEQLQSDSPPMLDMPEGNFEIHYRVMQYMKGSGVVDKVVYEGSVTATLQQGEVTVIPIP